MCNYDSLCFRQLPGAIAKEHKKSPDNAGVLWPTLLFEIAPRNAAVAARASSVLRKYEIHDEITITI